MLLSTFYNLNVGPKGQRLPMNAIDATRLYHEMARNARNPELHIRLRTYYFAMEAVGRLYTAEKFYGGMDNADRGHRQAYQYAAGVAIALLLDANHRDILRETNGLNLDSIPAAS